MRGRKEWRGGFYARRLRLVDSCTKRREPVSTRGPTLSAMRGRKVGNRTYPLETLVQSITACRARRLNVPSPLPKRVEAKLVGDLGSVHRVRQVLLVGKDEEEGVAELVFVEHALEFLARFRDTLPVVRVDDEDDALGVLEV